MWTYLIASALFPFYESITGLQSRGNPVITHFH